MLIKGDKIKLINPMGAFTNIGEICPILDVSDCGVITFSFGNGMHMGCMSADECERYFEKYEENNMASTVDEDDIDDLLGNSDVKIYTSFNKCTIVACKLPNGFVIVESSACVNPENYDAEMGVDICLNKIKDKVWELEGYYLQKRLYEESLCEEVLEEDFEYDEDEDDDEDYCDLISRSDCDYCDEYDCPYNNN